MVGNRYNNNINNNNNSAISIARIGLLGSVCTCAKHSRTMFELEIIMKYIYIYIFNDCFKSIIVPREALSRGSLLNIFK